MRAMLSAVSAWQRTLWYFGVLSSESAWACDATGHLLRLCRFGAYLIGEVIKHLGNAIVEVK
jgi:hypothetical protein